MAGLLLLVVPGMLGAAIGVGVRGLIARLSCRGRSRDRRTVASVVGSLAAGGLALGWLAACGDSGTVGQQAGGAGVRCARSPQPLRLITSGLGERFDRLALEDSPRFCEPPGPPTLNGNQVAEQPATVPVGNRIYGTCEPASGWDTGGCGPLLEIHSWPLCACEPSRGQARRGWLSGVVRALIRRLVHLSPQLARRLPSLARPAPSLPSTVAASLARMSASPDLASGEIDIELYTRDTTIVAFAPTAQLGEDAAAVLAIEATLHDLGARGHKVALSAGGSHA